jgi:hypothetical protein
MINMHTDVTLDSGAVVRCRPIPPHSTRAVLSRFKRPTVPNVELKSAAGGSETAVALPETPEWDAFMKEQEAYNEAVRMALDDFMLNYGIVGWKLDSESEWSTKPPDNWRVPALMSQYGVVDSDDLWEQRLHFIRYGLILTDDDSEKVDRACMIIPVTKEDVATAAIPFDSSGSTEPDTTSH